jgi:cysteinyl-tRNA synthetase
MTVHIYNSLSKQKEALVPIKDKKINMYACGVTVYDKCHIGHARSLYIFDVISRHLRNRNYDVTFIRNITDVDDKIINKANQLNKSFADVVKENIDFYRKDVESLQIDFADHEPRATENIDQMIQHIESLVAQDKAYVVDGDVYFKVRDFAGYGKLSGQSPEKMREAVRIDQDEKKKDPLDFCLWKKAKGGEPAWDSPWGQGRPGWHIECSVMSMHYLQCDTLDIHAGGRDLIFPHHENEIAQSEALTGKPFAKYWIHHGLLKIEGQKMAKSLGNFITLQDVLKKYSPNVLKLFYLQSHYASEIDFSWDKMEEMKKTYHRIEVLRAKLEQKFGARSIEASEDEGMGELVAYWDRFLEKMDDDFNTPQALSVVFDFVKYCNHLLDTDSALQEAKMSYALEILIRMSDALALTYEEEEEAIDEEIQALLAKRQEARKMKDYQRSDKIRDVLNEKGIIVEDGKDGQTWRRK